MIKPIVIAKTANLDPLAILPNMANRHGLITGATGTGKTVTLQKMAESFSAIGVPVFMADVKGDLSGIGASGVLSEKLQSRLASLKVDDWQANAVPVTFWDVYGEQGHPVRATVTGVGALLISRLLGLNDVQTGVLQIVFKVASDKNLLLLDLKDLKAVVRYVGENANDIKINYGNVSMASIGAIQRGLLTLEEQGGDQFFGEPMLDINDLMRINEGGRGIVNILVADKLYNSPTLYSTFLLWLLSRLYDTLPEVGDLEKPKLVFFFDEAHLLFTNANNALLEKIEQIVRLIRSKGVGVYFVTQNPLDVPDRVLGQLGNRVQHALRAFSPRDQKAVKAAAQTMRANPDFDAEEAITALGVGEALVSFLEEKGTPAIVQRAMITAPCSRMGALTKEERNTLINHSFLYGKYEERVDRISAFEKLSENKEVPNSSPSSVNTTTKPGTTNEDGGLLQVIKEFLFGRTGPRGGQYDGIVQKTSKRMTTKLINQILNALLGGKRRK